MTGTQAERRHIIFSGRVQGVGFRYKATAFAKRLGLTGWITNRMDGSVEAEIQGPAADINHMLKGLGEDRWIRITGLQSKRIPLQEGERGFRVRGY